MKSHQVTVGERDHTPLLCKIGLHKPYHYLPKVGGDLGEIAVACKRCGWGQDYFTGAWNISPSIVQDGVKNQAKVEYGRVLCLLRKVDSPQRQRDMALDILKEADKFTAEELESLHLNPLRKEGKHHDRCSHNRKHEHCSPN